MDHLILSKKRDLVLNKKEKGRNIEKKITIEHQFLSGIRDSRKPGSLMRGVGGVRKSMHQS